MAGEPESRARGGGRRRWGCWLSLWVGQLLLLPAPEAAAFRTASPRIITPPRGDKQFLFGTLENYITLYHEEGEPLVFVGAENKLYIYDFKTNDSRTEPFDIDGTESNCKNEDGKNYLTLLEKYEDKLLICGTNACNPTCWNWVNGTKQPGIDAQGLAPFGLSSNALVLIDGSEIYSTIKKHRYNGRIPRFRRIRGSAELYTSDTVMNNPQFVKAAIVKQDKPHNDKIYYFFREDNPEWTKNSVAPKIISRVAQLCKGDKGGSGSLSSSMWTTFLKATLLCVDAVTDRHFNLLQDIFIVESPTWSQTKVYGLFSNEWDYSAVCVFSVEEISSVFQTSPLKGYHGEMPTIRPGQCLEEQLTPHETFRVADSYPEVSRKVQRQAVFYSKHCYQQMGVHQAQVTDKATYNVLYLTTDRGTIHKVVLLPTGAMNVLEIQPFQSSATIRSMTLDNIRNELFVASTSGVVQLPMAMCGAYKNNCESCVLARDPHCGWIDGTCASIYDRDRYGNRTLFQALTHQVPSDICASSSRSNTKGDGANCHENITVTPLSRYYLNCSIESRHANYTWLHNGRSVAHCGSGHHHCIYFIDNVTDDLYGNYSCISREDWFSETLVTEYLVRPSPETREGRSSQLRDWATKASLSIWLGLLHIVAVVLIVQ